MPSNQRNDGRRSKAVLSQGEFYRVCEALKDNKEWFLDSRPNVVQTAARLSELTGLEVSRSSVKSAKQATGIEWVIKPTQRGTTREQRNWASRDIRVLAIHLRRLCIELGREVPSTLEDLYRRRSWKGGTGADSTEPFPEPDDE